MILSLCKWRTLSGAQVAFYLRRSQIGLRNAHLSPLTYYGFLQFDKDNKNNPGIRYQITALGKAAIAAPELYEELGKDMPPP